MSVFQKFAIGLGALLAFGLVFIHGAGLPARLGAGQEAGPPSVQTADASRADIYDEVQTEAAAEAIDAALATENSAQSAPPLLEEASVAAPIEAETTPTAASQTAAPTDAAPTEDAVDIAAETVEERAFDAARRCQQRVNRMMTGYQITFDNNSVEITRGVARLLTELSFEFEECGRVMVEIRGHTDARGDADRNLVLSRRRAEAVKAFLSRIGVGDIEMKSEGFGESRPIASNNSETGRARNRRIEFAVSPVDPIAGMSNSSGD